MDKKRPPFQTVLSSIKDMELSERDVMTRLGVSRQEFKDLCNGDKRITKDIAVRLEEIFGVSRDFWLREQNLYDKSRVL